MIGNVFAPSPLGVAFVKDDAAGVVMQFSPTPVYLQHGTGVPAETTAPDWSYQVFSWSENGAHVRCEWGRVLDSAVFRLSTDKTTDISITLPHDTWHSFNGVFNSVTDGVDAVCITGDGRFPVWKLRGDKGALSSGINWLPSGNVKVHLDSSHPVMLVAGFGALSDLATVGAKLDSARDAYQARRAQSTGDWGDFVDAIADNLNFTRVYSTYDKRVAHTVSRSWNPDPDYAPYFCWDSFFNGLLASLEDPRGAEETIRAVLTYQTPDGMVANVSHWAGTRSGAMSIMNSQPPVGALCVWKMEQRWPDLDFLREVYPKLVKWHQWWFKTSDANHDGLLEWYSGTGIFQEARFGCGWDDSPAFDGTKMIGTSINCDAVDLNSLYSMDADYLARLADMLGEPGDAVRFRLEHETMNNRINQSLWNEELGCYCSRLWDVDPSSPTGFSPGAFITRLTPMNFYPLICGAPDRAKADRMLQIMQDPGRFWGKWIIPTVAYDDPVFHQQDYWKGKVWAPVNYLLWQGIRNYCDKTQQADFVRKSVAIFMKNWKADGSCHENFSSIDGTGSSDSHYTWGALMCQIGIEALFEPSATGAPTSADLGFTEQIDIHNLPSGGKFYEVNNANAVTTISQESSSGR